jgi:hypothetical protein
LLRAISVAILVLATGLHAESEIHLSFNALERLLSKQLFSEDGRRYVRGDRTTKCNYAWLEQPKVWGENGRLVIRARFTGRTAWDVFGRCIGMGDSFDLRITSVPYYKDGSIGLSQTTAAPEPGSGGFYARGVSSALAASLNREFRYPLATELKRALDEPATLPEYPRDLRSFSVTKIVMSQNAVVLTLDFALAVR